MQQVQKLFDTDTLFHNQSFMTKSTRRGNTKHLVKESDGEHFKSLCGQRLCLGTPQTLTEQAETGINRNHPKHYSHKVCRNCRSLFEKKTGRKPCEDIQKYSGGENL
jgi:hypothetical protein